MGEGLLRQRRNLIIACVLLWVMKYGGVTFSKFSLAGFDVVFKNPNALILTVWIAFAYFLYRYYQYFSDEGIGKLQRVFSVALEQKCEPIICHLVKEKFPTNDDAFRYSYAFLKRDRWIYKGQIIGGYDPTYGAAIIEKFELAISRWKLRKGILSAVMDSVFRNSVVTSTCCLLLLLVSFSTIAAPTIGVEAFFVYEQSKPASVGCVERSDTHQSKAKPPGVALQLVTFFCFAKRR